jgi:hypothetical protein
MALTRVEKERITDSLLKVQSITNSLKQVDPNKIRAFEEIQECLEDTDKSLAEALRSSPPNAPPDAGPTRRN